MDCRECGVSVPEGYRFCGSCGARLDVSDDVASGEASAGRSMDVSQQSVAGGDVLWWPDAEGAAPTGDPGARPDAAQHQLPPSGQRFAQLRRLAGASLVLALIASVVTWLAQDRPLEAATDGHASASHNGIYTDPWPRDLDVVRWRRDQPRSAYRPLGTPVLGDGSVVVANDDAVAAIDVGDGRPRWRAEVDGTESLATGLGHVYARTGDALHALRREDGQLVWTTGLGRGVFDVAENVAPVVRNGRVHVVTPSGQVRAFDSDGEERWSVDSTALVEAGTDIRFAGGMVAAGDVLVVLAWGRDAWGRATALDVATGRTVWSVNVGAAVPHPPVAVGGAIAIVGTDQLTALDARSGDVRWRRDLELDTAGEALVTALGGNVAVLDAEGRFELFDWFDGDAMGTAVWYGAAPLRLTSVGDTSGPRGRGVLVHTADGEVAAFDVADARLQWRTHVGTPSAQSVGGSGLVVTPTVDGRVVAVDAATGERRWATSVRAQLGCALSGGHDLTYITTPDGPVHAFDTADGRVKWSIEQAAGKGAPAALAQQVAVLDGGLVRYVDTATGRTEQTGSAGGGAQHGVTHGGRHVIAVGSNPVGLGGGTGWVRALDPLTARSRWLAYLEEVPNSLATIANDLVLVGTRDGALIALSEGDGTERWRYEGASPPTSTPVATDRFVVVVDLGGWLTGLDRRDGSVVWQRRLGLPLEGSPVVAGGLVVTRLDQHRLIAVDVASGEQRWATSVDDELTSPVSVAGNRVFVGTHAGMATFDLEDGHLRDRWELDAPVVAPPVLSRHGAVVCLANGSVLALGG